MEIIELQPKIRAHVENHPNWVGSCIQVKTQSKWFLKNTLKNTSSTKMEYVCTKITVNNCYSE